MEPIEYKRYDTYLNGTAADTIVIDMPSLGYNFYNRIGNSIIINEIEAAISVKGTGLCWYYLVWTEAPYLPSGTFITTPQPLATIS